MEPQLEVEKALERLAQQLREAAGANLLGVALYGGLVKGRFTPGVSDVNVMVVLAKNGLEHLLPLSPPLVAALRDFRVVPFIVTPEDLMVSARLFPGKFLDIQASHRVLWGDVHLAGIPVSLEALLLRARQEIKNTELRLRLRVVERAGDPEALWRGLMASLPKLAVTLETLLRSRGIAVPADRPGLLRLGARELGLTDAKIEPFAGLRRTDQRPDDEMVRRLYALYLELLDELSAKLEVTAR
jgi:predicted nucleotidyltransferase